METENLTQYTRPQLAFSNRLRTVKVRRALLKNNLRPSPYAIFPISIHVFRFNLETAHLWGELKANWEKKGITIPSLDAQIAATAKQHRLTLVTRNVKDFKKVVLPLLNPFQD